MLRFRPPNSELGRMSGLPLVRRKHLLTLLGLVQSVPRWAWSHDLGESVVFDAWDHHWERDAKGSFVSYSLRTNGQHYNLLRSRAIRRPGHTRWQQHVDLVLAGKRKLVAIVPVGNKPRSDPNKGTKGWLPLYIEGHLRSDGAGQAWLVADRVVRVTVRD